MKPDVIAADTAGFGLPALGDATAVLATATCAVDSADRAEDGMSDQDDLICADAQNDVVMDADHTGKGRREE